MTLEIPYNMEKNEEEIEQIKHYFKITLARMAQMHKVQNENYNSVNKLRKELNMQKPVEYNPAIHLKRLDMNKLQYELIHAEVSEWLVNRGEEGIRLQKELIADIDEKHFNSGKIFTLNALHKIMKDDNKELLVLCKDVIWV